MSNFAERLKSLRLSKKLSQRQLAEKIGYGNTIILYWEKGQKEPNLKALETLSDFFNVSVDYLIGREDEFGNKINSDEDMYVKVVARSKGNTVKPHYEKLTPEDIKLFEEILEKLKKQ